MVADDLEYSINPVRRGVVMRKLLSVSPVRVALAVAVCVAACGVAVLTSHGTARGASAPTEAAVVVAQVSTVLPGSTTTLVPDLTVPNAVDVNIVAPASALVVPGSDTPDVTAPNTPTATTASYAELGWKAALAAGAAGQQFPDIVSYQLSVAGETPTGQQTNYLSGPIRAMPGGPERSPFSAIGSVPLTTLTQQLNSNLGTLTGVLGAGAVLASHTTTLPVNQANSAYAFEVDLKVSDLSVLSGHLADVLNGLDTGLVGDQTAPAEGLAINVVDTQGRRVSWWSAVRAGDGSAVADPPVSLSNGAAETATFTNLTGGPAFTAFAPGA